MNTFALLALLSVVGAAALFIALALFLRAIDRALEDIGGPATRFSTPTNYLSKIRLGVRAIEKQTDALGPSVTKLNTRLATILGGLRAIDTNLAGLIAAVSRQGRR
jgi:hypothetical protein